MITIQHTQEGLSRACIQAIVAKAGLNLLEPKLDYGIDGGFSEVSRVGTRYMSSGFCLEYQLKASTAWKMEENEIVYDLEAKNYNDLIVRRDNGAIPLILVLLALPEEQSQWLECSQMEVTIGGGCYWYCPNASAKKVSSRKRIRIPQDQLLTPVVARDLIEQVKKGQL